jgi:hypothetical protein
MGVREQIIFTEIDYDSIDQTRGIDITITTTAKTDAEAFALLQALGMPFSPDGRPKGFDDSQAADDGAPETDADSQATGSDSQAAGDDFRTTGDDSQATGDDSQEAGDGAPEAAAEDSDNQEGTD